MMGFVACLG